MLLQAQDCMNEKDYEKAIYFYELAAERDNKNSYKAQCTLVDLYLTGEVIEKDIKKAVYWLQIMAHDCDEIAKAKLKTINLNVNPEMLAKAYLMGNQGHKKNTQKAGYWIIKAIGSRYIEAAAQFKIAEYQSALNDGEYAELLIWLENAANDGNEFAKTMVACHNKEGKELREKLRKEGESHLQQAEEADATGEYQTASIKYKRSLFAFMPTIQSEETREIARAIKEKYIKRDQGLNLTQREQEILSLLLAGTAPKEIAYNLKIKYPTVNFHMNNLYRKLGIQSRAELFAKFKNK
jgi:DNA-binding CsgD family transcriptional regulator/TPR repeat protein